MVAVKNLVGTSHLKPKKGIASWRAHHEFHGFKKKHTWTTLKMKCAVKRCGRLAAVGAHVAIDNGKAHSGNRHIVPFCQKHNKYNTLTKGPLVLKPGSVLVSVGNGKVTKIA